MRLNIEYLALNYKSVFELSQCTSEIARFLYTEKEKQQEFVECVRQAILSRIEVKEPAK